MTRNTKTALAAGAALALTLLVTGCGAEATPSAATTDAAEAQEVLEITVGVTPIANAATVYLANELGYFEEEGLEVTPTLIQAAAAAIPSLLNDELQFALISPVPTLTAVSKGLDLTIAAVNDRYGSGDDYVDAAALVTAPGSGIAEVSDLAGKTVAVVGLKSAPELATRLALEEAGVDADSVEFVEIAIPDMTSALESDRVDAAVITDPFLSQAKAAGMTVLSQPFVEGMGGQVGTTWVTSGAFAAQHPDAVEGFADAIAKAVEYAIENPDAVREIMGEFTQLSDEARAASLLPFYSSEVAPADLQWIADAMHEQGFIAEAFDAGGVLWQR
ncbi:ABC transporter substrate-binding protein [Microbacterium sp. GXF7504]